MTSMPADTIVVVMVIVLAVLLSIAFCEGGAER